MNFTRNKAPFLNFNLGVLFLFSFAFLFSACNSNVEDNPTTEEGRKALLDAKKKELRTLKAQIAELEGGMSTKEAVNKARLVGVATQKKSSFIREIEIQATVQSDETSVVSVEMPGRITSINTDNGKFVRKGQHLLTIDVENIDLQIAELNTNLSLARDVFQRQQRLRDQNIGTEIQYLEAKNSVDRLEKTLEQLNFQKSKGIVKAPISGTVENKSVQVGEFAAPGMPLMYIISNAKVKVIANVPETYLKVVKKGTKVRVKFPSIQEERIARITDIGRSINPGNRTFAVELKLNNRDKVLKPNMLANMFFADYANEGVMVVDNSVVLQEIDGTSYVYVAEPKEGATGQFVARKRIVKAGESDAISREILEGIQDGDQLIVEGMRSLTDGEVIQISVKEDKSKK